MNFTGMIYVSLRQDRKFRRAQLRKATPQERRLWKEVLRRYPVAFLRKCALITRRSGFVSFYSPELRMAIDVETDRESKGELTVHESKKRMSLHSLGIYTLFIPESEIDGDLEAVRGCIDREVRKRTEWLEQKKKMPSAGENKG